MRKLVVITLLFLLGVLIIGVIALVTTRIFVGGGENIWKGEEAKEVKPGEFSNGQKYEIFKTDDFEVKYPYWPKVDKKNLLEPEKTKLAVTNAGCNFVVTAISVPTNTNFKDYAEKLAQEQIVKTKSKIITKEIKDNTSYFVGEITMGNTILHSVSYGYMTSKRQSYGIGFIAEKGQFDTACKSFVQEVVDSVKVK